MFIMNSIIYFLVLLQVMNSLSRRCTFNGHWDKCRSDCDSFDDRVTIKCGHNGLSCCPYLKSYELQSYKYPQDCGVTPYRNNGFVVGGKEILPDEFSWMASLEYKNRPNDVGACAGSVINFRYVLTAAHCVVGEQIDLYYGSV